MEAPPITEPEVNQLAAEWFHKLDVHAPVTDFLPMLAQKGLEMRFPEATLHGVTEFEKWYQGVTHFFFDEVHTLKSVDVKLASRQADVRVVVHWEASRWQPPAARSERIKLDAYQTWVVERSLETGKPVIVTYIVGSLEYQEGSPKL